LPHRKSNPKDPMPHFEKVTRITADYPVTTAAGGQNGVIHERKPKGHHRIPFPVSECRPERKSSHPE
jgi:hypothetical protein